METLRGYKSLHQQEKTSDDVMNTNDYFISDKEWDVDRECVCFDFVVVGSSFCAFAFTQRMLENNPEAKILIIERGLYLNLENRSPTDTFEEEMKSKTTPWKIAKKTAEGEYIKSLNGMNNIFGGKSAFWRCWSPKPSREEMTGWPEDVIWIVDEYFNDSEKLLNVLPASEIFSNDKPIFGQLQQVLVDKLKICQQEIEEITRIGHAPLAHAGKEKIRYKGFQKYSVSAPLVNLLQSTKRSSKGEQQPLKIKVDCIVKKINYESGKAVELETSNGKFILGKAKLILAMGTLPSTTLMLNSIPSTFKQSHGIGTRFTSHFISSIIARVRIPFNDGIVGTENWFSNLREKMQEHEMAAVYIAGENPTSKHQFHIQLTAISIETPVKNINDTMCHLPDVVAVSTLKQLLSYNYKTDSSYIAFICTSLGQLDHKNEENWFSLSNDDEDRPITSNATEDITSNATEDITSNATLQVVPNENDNALWQTMDDSAYKILEKYLDPGDQLEYFHVDSKSQFSSWKKERPPTNQIRKSDLVHEASTMWIGDDTSSPVGLDYRFRGIENVYLTGGALWPTGASWNPTCTMVALAMHLADSLSKYEKLTS